MDSQLDSVDITVVQKPIYVSFECPDCGHDNDIPFDEFRAMHGDEPDWPYETIKCARCCKEFAIDDIEYD